MPENSIATMENLPAELFNLIIDRCEHSSLKELRLANRFYREAVTPRVFEHFYMCILDDSLNRLISISRSSVMRHIRCLTVYIDFLPGWQYEEWERAINYKEDIIYWKGLSLDQGQSTFRAGLNPREQLPFDLPNTIDLDGDHAPRHNFSPKQLIDGFKAFEAARKQQLYWHESRQGMVLRECIAMLPALDTVICVPAAVKQFQAARGTWPVWKRMRRDIFVDPKDLDHQAYTPLESKNEEFSRRISFTVLEAIAFRASFSGTKQITRLELHSQQRGSWERMVSSAHAVWFPTFKRNLNTIPEGFRNLTYINLCVTYLTSDHLDSLSCLMELTKFLHAANRLRSLNLSFSGCRRSYENDPLYPQPIEDNLYPFLDGRPSWPFIEHLGLNMHVQHRELLSFLQFLSPSLQSLQLTDMGVEDAGELVTRIPQILKLETVQITRIWHTHSRQPPRYLCIFPEGINVESPSESAVRRYLLGKTTECPDLGLYGEATTESYENHFAGWNTFTDDEG